MKKLLIAAFAAPLLLTSCQTFRPDRQDEPASDLVSSDFSTGKNAELPDQYLWWQDFQSAQLDRLIAECMGGNLTLLQAEARLRQAKARAIQAGAALTPTLGLEAGASGTQLRSTDTTGTTTTVGSEAYSFGLAASYEVDLWGRIRSSRNNAKELFAASREDLNAAAISVTAQAASTWLLYTEKMAQIAVLNEQLSTNRKVTHTLEQRSLKGRSTALEVYQQKQTLAATEALLPQAEAEAKALLSSLAIIQGKAPQSFAVPKTKALPPLPKLPATGLPADLLNNRPDIQAAYLRLSAADWAVASAKANRLPALSLTGTAQYNSDSFDSLFDNWLLNLAGNLTAPLLDGGRRKAEVDLQTALADERLAAYRATVLDAIKEVEDALSYELRIGENLAAQQRELDYAGKALTAARTRYLNGGIDYLNVLQALTSVQRLQRSTLTTQRLLLTNRVSLYRALGGIRLSNKQLKQLEAASISTAKEPQS